MAKSALSPRLLDADNWKGTDDDVWYMRWRIKLKYLFAYGPRATEWWAKWREWPITLFATWGKGYLRLETESWERDSSRDYVIEPPGDRRAVYNVRVSGAYLSRVQYYCRWHVQVQWPLMIAAHRYNSAADVPVYGEPRPDTDGKLWFFYVGAHRDADKVYWFPSAYLGRNWK